MRHHPLVLAYLRTSRYVPPRWEAVRDAIPAFFDLLAQEREPGVRAVLGHWLFGYIHPYPDGKGRMARFMMNAMLASGGYPWTVVRVEDRTRISRRSTVRASTATSSLSQALSRNVCAGRWSRKANHHREVPR
jgi:Fic family protein